MTMDIDNNVSDISRKLGEISLVMADGYHFVIMRELVEGWNNMADKGDERAKEMMDIINKFHRLCLTVQGMK